jgi:glycosyltransferase involved in cell wall biosynthesis
MKRTLVLLTTNHPFTHTGGETMFVGPELLALARAFEQVLVVPLHDDGERLVLPAGSDVDLGLAERWRRRRWRWALRALHWPGFWTELRRGWQRGGAVGAARVWRWAAVAAAAWDWMRSSLQAEAPLLYTYWRGGPTLAAARWSAQHPGTVAITRVHRYELYDEAFDPPFQPWTSVYASLDRVITVAQQGADYLQARGVGRVSVFRLGVTAAGRRAEASNDGTWRLVSCSSLTTVKRVERCAEVACELARRHPQQAVEWTHFGDGPTLDAVQAALRHAPPNLRATLAGQVANEDVLAHYRTRPVDAFLLLSDSEGLPVSIQEALAHGVPVLATDVGGVAEAVSASGDNGSLLPAGAPVDRIADALQGLLLASVAEREARREAAWQRWACEFDAERNHTELAALLAGLKQRPR